MLLTNLEYVQQLAAALGDIGDECKGFEGVGQDPETGENYVFWAVRVVRDNLVVMCNISDRMQLYPQEEVIAILRAEVQYAFDQ